MLRRYFALRPAPTPARRARSPAAERLEERLQLSGLTGHGGGVAARVTPSHHRVAATSGPPRSAPTTAIGPPHHAGHRTGRAASATSPQVRERPGPWCRPSATGPATFGPAGTVTTAIGTVRPRPTTS